VHLAPFGVPEVAAAELKANLDHFRGLLALYGKGADVPVWSTEGGLEDTTWFRGLDFPGLPPLRLRTLIHAMAGARRVVQGSAIMQKYGIRKHFIYLHNLPASGPGAHLNTAMIDLNNAPRSKLIARVAMAEQVDGYTLAGDVHRVDEGRFWAFVYGRADASTTVLWWCGDEGTLRLEIDWPVPPLDQVDIMGNAHPWQAAAQVTDEPAYVRLQAAPEAVLRALEKATLTVVHEPLPLPPAGAMHRELQMPADPR